jgi:hypothetical protein
MTPGVKRSPLAALVVGVGIQLVAPGARAEPPTKQACVAAYDRAQDLRRTGHLVAARAQLITCSQPSCPAAATDDCIQWLRDVEQSLPSVVVSARDAGGREAASLRVFVDGAPLADAQSGRALEIDPGAHTLRFESSLGPAVEEHVTILEGQKHRTISVILGPPASGQASPGPLAPAGPAAPERPIGAMIWILGGVGVAGLGVFAGFGAKSLGDESALRSTCAPHCAAGDVDAIRHEHTAADVGLGIGVASLAVATLLFFTRPTTTPPRPSSTAGAGFSFGAGTATLGGTF